MYSKWHRHNVWETAIWTMLTGRKLVRETDGCYRLVEAENVKPTDTVIVNELLPCKATVLEDCTLNFKITKDMTNVSIYYREDPSEIEKACREALPKLYKSFLK